LCPKANGAMFSHMAVMFANALYRRGRAEAGWRTLEDIYQQGATFAAGRIYPGIPEYFSPRGRGMYPWLTGSASWYILTLVQWTFGVRGDLGDLLLEPQLQPAQFNADGLAEIDTLFAGRRLRIRYHNPQRLPAAQVRASGLTINRAAVQAEHTPAGLRLSRSQLHHLPADHSHTVDVTLQPVHAPTP